MCTINKLLFLYFQTICYHLQALCVRGNYRPPIHSIERINQVQPNEHFRRHRVPVKMATSKPNTDFIKCNHYSSSCGNNTEQWRIQDFSEGAPTYYLTNFPRKLLENVEILVQEGRGTSIAQSPLRQARR